MRRSPPAATRARSGSSKTGSTGAPLSLVRVEAGFRDETSGRVFDVLGTEIGGGSGRLTPVEHLDTFRFAIAAFDTGVELV